MAHLARTLRTLRHCRPGQLYWRLRYRCEMRRPPASISVPGELEVRDDYPRELVESSECESEMVLDAAWLTAMEQGHFSHLNETRRLGIDPTNWLIGNRGTDRLWTVTLHYHAWLERLARLVMSNDGDIRSRSDLLLRRLLDDWIARGSLTVEGSRTLVWNAYAIATRISHWCRSYHLLGDHGRKHWLELENRFLASLWSQADYLSRHIEWDLRGNHLLRDALGLVWAGRFFGGRDAKQWLAQGTRLAVDQAREQVLADGGHFERSPMYHVEVMDDIVALAVLVEQEKAKTFLRHSWQHMAQWLAWVRHPDGNVPLFNDGGLNGSLSPNVMFAKGKRLLGIDVDTTPLTGGQWFRDFGLIVWHRRPWSLFFDVGPVGVNYQPGHVHADTLALEASYEGHRLFIDPGTFSYDNDETRRYDRSTTAHNTVAIDATDSSEVWHVFRVGRRARPLGAEYEATDEVFRAAGSHDGYDHLPGRPRHRREVSVDRSGTLTIVDRIEGHGRHELSGGLLVHPDWLVALGDDHWALEWGPARLRVTIDDNRFDRTVRQVEYHPEYGLAQQAPRLSWRAVVELPITLTTRVERTATPPAEREDDKS